MPSSYKRKTNRGLWASDAMWEAVNTIEKGDKSIREAAKAFGVPKSTLQRKLNSPNRDFSASLGRKCTLGAENKCQLEQLILDFEGRGFGLSRREVKELAYEFAEHNGLKHIFNHQSKSAGRFWLEGFLRRHPLISVRKAEGLSRARAIGMNRQVVNNFFDKYEGLLTREDLHNAPERLYNVDETGMPLHNRPGHVLAAKGKRSVVSVTNTEKGENITVVAACSAVGNYVPPFVIMKGRRFREEFEDGLPPGSKVRMSETGYFNKDLFLEWLQHFRKYSVSGKIILVTDGHTSHVKSAAALRYCMDNNIILVCLPGHTTKYLQPLDRTVFKPLKTFYHYAANQFVRSHPGASLSKFRFGALFATAWGKAATAGNAVSGFKACGLCPPDRNAIPEFAFTPSETTEREIPCPVLPSNQRAEQEADSEIEESGTNLQAADLPPLPDKIHSQENSVDANVASTPSSSKSVGLSFYDISPLPAVERPITGRQRKKQQDGELTTDAYLSEIEEAESTASKRKTCRKSTSKEIKKKGKLPAKVKKSAPSGAADDPLNYCGICRGFFYDDAADTKWVESQICSFWFHEECVDAAGAFNFVCDECS